jgi:chromosome segregation protein
MTIRLKRLDLHGFKSFPGSTAFEFDSGITAIIGPNGSGKSNIADAVRWVLGEQSYSNLRGRRAEDVIFSGSSARSPLGMAEVSLTLDNPDGDLPTPFHEVTITRRAYRSGENQYLLNGARVRLKDIAQITASLGQAYTVIGQGLVDAALSQRPEERRGLFEHAAGITGLRLKHAATARHLSETEANSERLEDLLREIEPRLRTLERQARQAREHARVRSDLHTAYLTLYGALWHDACRRIGQARAAVEVAEEQLAAAESVALAARAAQRQLESKLAEHRERRRELEERLRELQHEEQTAAHRIDLLDHREKSLGEQVEQLDASIHGLDRRQAEIDTQRDSIERERQASDASVAQLRDELDERQAALAQVIDQRDRLEQSLAATSREHERVQRLIYEVDARRRYLDRHREEIARRHASLERELTGHDDRRTHLVDSAASHDAALAELARRREELEGEHGTLVRQRDAYRQQRQAIARRLDVVDHCIVERDARLEALERLRDSGAGLYAGTRAVLDAAKRGEISGLIGTLASQITVPAELEAALEAALGSHLQDLIVHTWRDAERAITYLKRTDAGRATLQPLDTVRWQPANSRPSLDHPGVLGVAADLIEFAPPIELVVRGLLDRVVVTEDLTATRAILSRLRPGWSVVTLAGEVSRSSGAVTGGARVRQSGTLARERDLRELPAEIEALRAERQRIDTERAASEAAEGDVSTRLDQLAADLQGVSRESGRLEIERDRIRRQIQEHDERWHQAAASIDELQTTLAEVDEEVAATGAERTDLERQERELLARRDRLAGELRQLDQRVAGDDLHRLESELDLLRERQRALDQRRGDLVSQSEQIARERCQAGQRRSELIRQREEIAGERTKLQRTLDETRSALDGLRARLEPVDCEIEEVAAAVERSRLEIDARANDERHRERERDIRRFDLRREENDLTLLLERAGDALDDPEPRALLEQQTPPEQFDRASSEARIDRLRAQLRRIGTFGDEVIEQYEHESERYGFLRKQLDDVQRASESLRALLSELERAMSDEFDKTFGQVAQAFEVTFRTLFGGGQARLVRAYDGESAGVDIIVQPPGKRLQSLALLSGGERALTAVALLFAILRVNPSPFCLLDEVDAALDESNVVRFRDELRDLSRRTQFVVVTHNRATIEGADTLYGITMGDDAVSRVISLKLPANAPVT